MYGAIEKNKLLLLLLYYYESINFISCHNKAHKKPKYDNPSGHKINHPTTDLLQPKLSNR